MGGQNLVDMRLGLAGTIGAKRIHQPAHRVRRQQHGGRRDIEIEAEAKRVFRQKPGDDAARQSGIGDGFARKVRKAVFGVEGEHVILTLDREELRFDLIA